jgi:OHCU decarboxylase
MEGLNQLNSLSDEEARKELLRCCGSRRWSRAMAEARPFRDLRQLLQTAESVWKELGPSDWLQAFEAHPRIGDKAALKKKWAGQEQAGAAGASEATLDALADGNLRYEQRFGHIFIVCATGKSADEMLSLLNSRLPNEPVAELKIAAEEQRKITELRLKKLVEENGGAE